MMVAIALGLGEPLNAIQLLWLNLVSDIFPGLALALGQQEPDVLSQSPSPDEPLIKPSDFQRITFESATPIPEYSYSLWVRHSQIRRGSRLAPLPL